ncbi:hypothetical protein CLU86_1157 [Acidovorax sp. 62]|nr:hypothetical protein CLU86_1157 [Acidovorax sp. 62]
MPFNVLACLLLSGFTAAVYVFHYSRGGARGISGFFLAFVSGACFASFVYLAQFAEMFRILGVER